MKCKVFLPTVEEAFANCWKFVVDELHDEYETIHGVHVTDYFKKHFKISLVSAPDGVSIGKGNWGWSHLVFKSKSAYVLFMLEWS